MAEKAYIKSQKNRFLILFGTQVLLLLLMIITNQIWYAMNDDTAMVDIAGGGYGEPCEYTIYIHFLMGLVYKYLFILLPQINWVTISYLIAYLLSFAAIDWVFALKERIFLLSYTVLTSIFLICLNYFTFTVVAYCGSIAGILVLTDAAYNKNMRLCKWIYGGLLIGLGAIFRGEAMKSLVIVYSGEILWNLKHKRSILFALIGIFCIILMYLGIGSNMFLEKLNPVEKQGLAWEEVRSQATDRQQVPYNVERFAEHGISEEQYKAIYAGFYFDRSHLTIQNFKDLSQLNTAANKYNSDVIGYFQYIFNRIWGQNTFSQIYLLLFVAVLIYFLAQSFIENQKKEVHAFYILCSTLAADFVFYFIQRAPYRVIMPNFILATLIILLNCKECVPNELKAPKQQSAARHLTRSLMLFFIFPVLTISQLYLANDVQPYCVKPSFRQVENLDIVMEYLSQNDDTLWLAGDTQVFDLTVARSIWKHAAGEGYCVPVGGWVMYTVPYYQLLQHFNITNTDNLLLESIDNEHIKILTSCGDHFPEYQSFILAWLKKYYNIDAQFVKIEDVLQSSIRTWSVYVIRKVDGNLPVV